MHGGPGPCSPLRPGRRKLPCRSLRTARPETTEVILEASPPLEYPTPWSTHFCWEARAKLSCFSREMPNRSATFSEVILEDRQQTVQEKSHSLGTGQAVELCSELWALSL